VDGPVADNMKQVILSDFGDHKIAADEAKYEFTIYVLSNCGIPDSEIEKCFPDGGFLDFEAKHKINLRELLAKHQVTIIDNGDGEMEIFVGSEMIARWEKCKFVLKKSHPKAHKPEELYIEIHAEYWTSFDEDDNE
jgi:hypothetical protein